MGRQRNNPQSKGKEESSERMLNEIDTSQLSDNEFKTMEAQLAQCESPKTTGKL